MSESHRRRWAELSPEERERRLALLRGHVTKSRSAEATQNISAAMKQCWADGKMVYRSRACRHCGEQFSPNSPPQRYCSDDCRLENRRLHLHGISSADYRALLRAQKGVCALCGKKRFGWLKGKRELAIDHDHETGKVRGLLCGDCNTALGRFGEDPARLRAAADYLETGFIPR